MKWCAHNHGWIWVALLALAGVTHRAGAQSRYLSQYQEPQWLSFKISEVSAGAYAEGTFEDTSFKNSSTSYSHEHLFVGPAAGISAYGFIYHPNLLSYYINSEGAYGLSTDKVTGSPSRSQWEYLGRFSGSVEFLANKPYHAGFFADYDHTFRDDDFFNRSIVDSWRYGGRVGYTLKQWSFHADYTHRDEDVSALSGLSTTHDDALNVNLSQDRKNGGTALNYNYDKFTRTDLGALATGQYQAISIADAERLGKFERYKLNSSASYIHRDDTSELSDEVLANARLDVAIRPTLRNYDDFDYDHFESSGFTSDNYGGQASLEHHLYESLVSTLTGRATDYEASDQFSSGYTRRFGGGFTEDYTKHVSDSARLHVLNFLFLEHTDQQTISTVQNERHAFGESGAPPDSFFLNQPSVITSTILITDLQHTLPGYLENLDYIVTPFGSRTQIQRLPGSRIPTGGSVLVDYKVQPTPAGNYETLTEAFQVRLDFWHDLVGVYGRINLSLNDAPADLRIQSVHAYTVGSDLSWRWLRAGAEYELYYSTESDYRAARLFQSLFFHLDQASTLSLDFTETRTEYIDVPRTEEDYRFITRYHRTLTHRLALDTDAGIGIRRGNSVDQILATLRPSLRYVVGKTTVDAGYDFEYESFLNNEERLRHLFTLRIKRYF